MGWFKSFFKKAAPIAGSILGSLVGGPVGGAIGGGLGGLASGQNIADSLITGGTSYAGGSIGSSIGSSLGGSLGGALGGSAASTAIPAVVGRNIGAVLGSGVGAYSSLPVSSGFDMGDASLPAAPPSPKPFEPKQDAQKELPASLSGFASLTPQQQSSNIATEGVYGGGSGPQEQEYFMNLINRRLVDESGGVSDQSELSPIEQSYLQRLGLGGYSNTNNLLEAMSTWRPN